MNIWSISKTLISWHISQFFVDCKGHLFKLCLNFLPSFIIFFCLDLITSHLIVLPKKKKYETNSTEKIDLNSLSLYVYLIPQIHILLIIYFMCSNFLELLFHENLICFVDNHIESVFVRKGLISCHEGSKTLAGHPWMRWTFTCVVTCKLIGIFESLFFFSSIHSCFSDFTLLVPSECLATHATKLSSNSFCEKLLWHYQKNIVLCIKLTCDKLIKSNNLYLSRNAEDDNQKTNY